MTLFTKSMAFTKSIAAVALVAAFAQPVQAFDLKGAMDSANKAVDQAQKKATDATNRSQATVDGARLAGDTATLVNDLSSQLGVSTEQAAGGTAALFSLAKTQLSGDQFSGVTDQVSGLGTLLGGGQGAGGGLLSGVLGNVKTLAGVQQAFNALGLSPEMIGQFTPIITQFLGNQGVAGPVIGALQNLWAPAT
ncbi:DUF2780 domain-containing protein [Alloalcanivorax sp. C16-1]|uniref:DUF2780 domain-containing protein n=1 Tax=Alloalcanivorax sp. C16-1 TaxID=3390051 RepID=UPI0039705B8C